MSRCSWCGREVAAGTTVCPYPDCGRPIDGQAASPGEMASPAAPPPPGSSGQASTGGMNSTITPGEMVSRAAPPPPGSRPGEMSSRAAPPPPGPAKPGEMSSRAAPPPPQQYGTQQPGIGQPGMQQYGTPPPGMQQPGIQQPGIQQPGMQQPGMQQPGMQQPGMQQPGMQQPGMQQPGMQQPGSAVQQPGMQGTSQPMSLFGSASSAPSAKTTPETPPEAPPEAPPAPPAEQSEPQPSFTPGFGAGVGLVTDMRVADLPEPVQQPAAELQRDIVGKRRRFRWFAYGAAAAAAIGFFSWLFYYQNTTLQYAKIDSVHADRDPLDPETVIFSFTPSKTGRVGFIHKEGDSGETERFAYASTIGKKIEYRWRLPQVVDNEPFRVRSLDGWSLMTQECRVQSPRPEYMAAFDIPADIDEPADSDPQIAIDEPSTDVVATDTNDPTAVVVSDAMADNLDMARIHVQLDWQDKSVDLDAYLEGPVPGGDRFSVSSRDRSSAMINSDIVRVDTSGGTPGGPESIDVLRIAPGLYRCFVHDWTNRADGTSKALTTSGAEVLLDCAGGTYRFTPPVGEPANLWEVFALEVTDDGDARVRGINEYRADHYDTVGLYDYRTRENRSEWITNYGGSEITERVVADGLNWLARHQGRQGFWSSETMGAGQFSQCKGTPCGGEGRRYEVGQTGLALLAFQAGGHYYYNGRTYTPNVKRGLDWLVSVQRPDGALVSDKPQGGHSRYHTYYMYDHGIATFALADACASARATGQQVDPKYMAALARAVKYIESQQHEDGGWRYTDKFDQPSDTSVSGWQVLALKSAMEAGIEIDYMTIEKAGDFFSRLLSGENGRTLYQRNGPVAEQQSDATTGIGMLARQFLLGQADSPIVQQAAEYLAQLAKMRSAEGAAENRTLEYELAWNYYTWYHGTLALFYAGGEPWQTWNPIVRDTIVKLQRHEGCERGSWDPDTKNGDRGGRVYSTALAVLTLEVYYRYAKPTGPTGPRFETLTPYEAIERYETVRPERVRVYGDDEVIIIEDPEEFPDDMGNRRLQIYNDNTRLPPPTSAEDAVNRAL